MNKKTYLSCVMDEIDRLKQHATPDEIDLLNVVSFNHTSVDRCIYGQLTGCCMSERARELMEKCVVVCVVSPDASSTIKSEWVGIKREISNKEPAILIEEDFYAEGVRKLKMMTALEVYLYMKPSKGLDIIEYMKGERQKLTL